MKLLNKSNVIYEGSLAVVRYVTSWGAYNELSLTSDKSKTNCLIEMVYLKLKWKYSFLFKAR